MFDTIIAKVVEWWQHGFWEKAGIVATALALLSALVGAVVRVARGARFLIHWFADREQRAPLEGLVTGLPRETPKFVGRDEENAWLRRTLGERCVVAVTGPPLIGKTWLLSNFVLSEGWEKRCVYMGLKKGCGLSALLAAINTELMRLGSDHFDPTWRRQEIAASVKLTRLTEILCEGEWVIILDAYERAGRGGEVDEAVRAWKNGLGKSRVMLGSRTRPHWLEEGEAWVVKPLSPEQMAQLCRLIGLTSDEVTDACGKLAGLPGAAGLFRAVVERRGPAAAMRLVGGSAEVIGRRLFRAALAAAPESARDVWLVAAWFPQPVSRDAAGAICGTQVFADGVKLLEEWTVVTEAAPRLDLHHHAVQAGARALRWQRRKRLEWGKRIAHYYAQFAEGNANDRAAIEAELENILAAARLAFQYREWEALWAMGAALDDPLDFAGRWTAREELLRLCYGGARQAGDTQKRGDFAHNLGVALQQRGKLEEAEGFYTQARDAFRDIGDRRGEAATLHQLGNVAYLRGKLEEAEGLYRQSLEIERDVGNRPGEAGTLHQLGMVAQASGKLEEAEGFYQQSLAIKREVGDQPGEANTLQQLGNVAYLRGKLAEAEGFYQQNLAIKREVGDRPGEAKTLAQMALLAEAQGNLKLAVDRTEKACAMFEEMGLAEKEQARTELERLRKRLAEEG